MKYSALFSILCCAIPATALADSETAAPPKEMQLKDLRLRTWQDSNLG